MNPPRPGAAALTELHASVLSSYRLARRRLQAVADLEQRHGDKPLAYLVGLAAAAHPDDVPGQPKDAAL